MPYYLFSHSETGEVREIFFHMNDEKIYNGDDNEEPGLWKREYVSPQSSIDTQLDPFSERDFISKLGNKTKTIGELWDISKEQSRKRAEQMGGTDPIKQKYFDKYAKIRKGVRHPAEQAAKKEKIVENAAKEIKKILS